MKFLKIVCAALILTSCGGGKSGLNKDTKADFTIDQAKMKELSMSEEDAVRKPYMDKVIEMKGIITESKKAVSSASPNKYSFHLSETAVEDGSKYTICYTDEDPASMVGKNVTVKGKFDYAGVVTVNDCVYY
jgi:hypothetical protein